MPLEPDVDNLDDLVESNPAFDDPVNQGDDHDRITKRGVLGNITGSADETRLLSNREVVALINANSLELRPTAAGGEEYQLNFGDADATKTHGGLRYDGVDLLALINDALQGIIELRGSDAAPDDRKLATFDPTLGFEFFRAGLLMLQGQASVLTLKAEDESSVAIRLESDASVSYLTITGAPASPSLLRAEVDGAGMILQGMTAGTVLVNMATFDPDTGANFTIDGAVALGVVDGSTVGANVGAIQLNGITTWTTGVGSPEGVVSAAPGSIYSDTVSGSAAPLWMKNFSGGNTGWLQIASVP